MHARCPDPLRRTVGAAIMLEAEARGLVEEQGVALLAVDGIQDIRPAKRSDLREREVGDVVRDLKALARELNMPVVATSP